MDLNAIDDRLEELLKARNPKKTLLDHGDELLMSADFLFEVGHAFRSILVRTWAEGGLEPDRLGLFPEPAAWLKVNLDEAIRPPRKFASLFEHPPEDGLHLIATAFETDKNRLTNRLNALVTSPGWSTIRSFMLKPIDGAMASTPLEAFVQADEVANLDAFVLAGLSRFGVNLNKVLAQSALTARCRQFGLINVHWDHNYAIAFADRLAEHARQPAWESLWLGAPYQAIGTGTQNRFGREGLAHLLHRLDPIHLNELRLGGTSLDLQGIATLLESPLPSQLQTLELSHNPIGPGGSAMERWPTDAPLERLDLSRCALGDPEAIALARAPGLTRLKVLRLKNNQIGDAGAQALASSPHLTALQRLDLSRNRVGDAGARRLADSETLVSLSSLDLLGCPLGVEGVRALMTGRRFANNAERLGLIPAKGVATTTRSTLVRKLAKLGVRVSGKP